MSIILQFSTFQVISVNNDIRFMLKRETGDIGDNKTTARKTIISATLQRFRDEERSIYATCQSCHQKKQSVNIL